MDCDSSKYRTAYNTDAGIKKATNQDALCIKSADTDFGQALFCAVCDGMGGLSKGELASAEVIRAVSGWFDSAFPGLLYNGFTYEKLIAQWSEIIEEQNKKLLNYGEQYGIKLGTTITALLFINGNYYIIHVGDSRAYEIGESVLQLTQDQTFVAREVKRGNMSPQEAKTDSRRNVLLQCVGASRSVKPDYMAGRIKENCTYMLCTDGFIHELNEREIYENLNRDALIDEPAMAQRGKLMVETIKARMEQDNITVLLIRT